VKAAEKSSSGSRRRTRDLAQRFLSEANVFDRLALLVARSRHARSKVQKSGLSALGGLASLSE
jgi:hypothetical protein